MTSHTRCAIFRTPHPKNIFHWLIFPQPISIRSTSTTYLSAAYIGLQWLFRKRQYAQKCRKYEKTSVPFFLFSLNSVYRVPKKFQGNPVCFIARDKHDLTELLAARKNCIFGAPLRLWLLNLYFSWNSTPFVAPISFQHIFSEDELSMQTK